MVTDLPAPAAPAVPRSLTLQPAAPVAANEGPQLTGPLIVIGLLAVAALVLSRRKKKQAGWITVLETASLGPKRSLVVARIGDETVLFGSGEGGIALLKSGLTRTEAAPVPAEPSFAQLLDESADDQALRMKLMAGQPARVEAPYGRVG